MQNYLNILKNVLQNGSYHNDRTGTGTIRIMGAIFEHDMESGFPIVTTKELNYRSAFVEMLGFIKGYNNAAQFRALGTGVWDANANVNTEWLNNTNRLGTDDLGRIYGVQWRSWRSPEGYITDQLAKAIDLVYNNPDSRRNIVTAWNPSELDQMALPPCHTDWQLIADNEKNELSLRFTMRSNERLI